MSETACMTPSHSRRQSALQRSCEEGAVTSVNDPIIPDTLELISALQINSSGRLGGVDGAQSCADELERRLEVPSCAAGETVKLRYLSETHFMR